MDRDGTVTVCDDHDGQWLPWVGNLRLAPVVNRTENNLGSLILGSHLISSHNNLRESSALQYIMKQGLLAFVYPLL